MSIDDMVVRDPRITKLAAIVGWSRREMVGCLVLDVWPICYDQREHIIAADLINIAAGHDGFAAAMVSAGLAEWVRGNLKVRVKGAQERIEYLERKREAGRVGGIKSGKSRQQNSSTHDGGAEALGNPSVPDPSPSPPSAPVPASVPVQIKNSAAPSAGGSPPGLFGEFEKAIERNLGDVGLAKARRKPKPSEPSDSERTSVRILLDKLGAHNGVTYTATGEHTRLIVNHLRNGVSEHDLRKVIGYCALELDWKNKPDQLPYLRPETLFGPKTISKYLDPARSWFDKLPLDGAHEEASYAG